MIKIKDYLEERLFSEKEEDFTIKYKFLFKKVKLLPLLFSIHEKIMWMIYLFIIIGIIDSELHFDILAHSIKDLMLYSSVLVLALINSMILYYFPYKSDRYKNNENLFIPFMLVSFMLLFILNNEIGYFGILVSMISIIFFFYVQDNFRFTYCMLTDMMMHEIQNYLKLYPDDKSSIAEILSFYKNKIAYKKWFLEIVYISSMILAYLMGFMLIVLILFGLYMFISNGTTSKAVDGGSSMITMIIFIYILSVLNILVVLFKKMLSDSTLKHDFKNSIKN